MLEVNPRASRTVPFVSKATGVPLAKIAARCMAGQQPGGSRASPRRWSRRTICVKEAVFPFVKFPGVDPMLGPEMKSTGEVMGIGRYLWRGLRQGQRGQRHLAAAFGPGFHLSVREADKPLR